MGKTEISTLQIIANLASSFSGPAGSIEGETAEGLAFLLYFLRNRNNLLEDKKFWETCEIDYLKCFYYSTLRCLPKQTNLLDHLVKQIVSNALQNKLLPDLAAAYSILLEDEKTRNPLNLFKFIGDSLKDLEKEMLSLYGEEVIDLLHLYEELRKHPAGASSPLMEEVLSRLSVRYEITGEEEE